MGGIGVSGPGRRQNQFHYSEILNFVHTDTAINVTQIFYDIE